MNDLLKLLHNPYSKAVPETGSHLSKSMLCDFDAQNKDIDDVQRGSPSSVAAKIRKNIDYKSVVPVWACDIRVS